MKQQMIVYSISLLFFPLLITPTVHAQSPTEVVKGKVDKILAILRDPSVSDLSEEGKRSQIRNLINEAFNWDEASQRSLGIYWEEFEEIQAKDAKYYLWIARAVYYLVD